MTATSNAWVRASPRRPTGWSSCRAPRSCPGLIDSHVHLTSTGLSLHGDGSSEVRSKEELLAAVRARAVPEAEVVVLHGFDETRWDRPEHPGIEELDAASTAPLVIGRADGHLALVNAATIRLAGIDDVAGLERGPDGAPTGRVTGAANRAVRRWLAASRTEHLIEELQLDAAGLAAARGVTSLHEMSMPREDGERDLEVLLRHRAKLPVDVVPIPATMDVPRAIELGLATIGGDLPVDGSIGARTAALSSPYADGPDEGVAYYDDDELAGFFHDAHGAGLQVGVHAIGDRAIEQVLGAWERIYGALDSRERRHFRARRHRIEHFEMPSVPHVERAAMLGLVVSVQPAFDRLWGQVGGLYEIGVGPERAAVMNPFRTMLDRGIVLGAGSDSPVTPFGSVARDRRDGATPRSRRTTVADRSDPDPHRGQRSTGPSGREEGDRSSRGCTPTSAPTTSIRSRRPTWKDCGRS